MSYFATFHGRRAERFALSLPKVVAVSISPQNSWLLTLVPYKSDPNLQIWDLKTGELHFSVIQKSFSRQVLLLAFSKVALAISPMGQHRRPCDVPSRRRCMFLLKPRSQITLYNGHNFTDQSMLQELHSSDSSVAAPFTVNSTSYVSLSPSSLCPAVCLALFRSFASSWCSRRCETVRECSPISLTNREHPGTTSLCSAIVGF